MDFSSFFLFCVAHSLSVGFTNLSAFLKDRFHDFITGKHADSPSPVGRKIDGRDFGGQFRHLFLQILDSLCQQVLCHGYSLRGGEAASRFYFSAEYIDYRLPGLWRFSTFDSTLSKGPSKEDFL
jgi:hypothetical protein